MSIKLLLIHFAPVFRFYLPKFSTSQGNVKVSPTTALYVCPCERNLACDVDDVVASDLLPTAWKKREKEKEKRKFKSHFHR
jgi:hypothetical protein